MGRTSKIRRLPQELREQLHAMMDSGHTLEEIAQHLRSLGGDVSRSGIGRYAQRQEKIMESIRRSKEAAEVVVGKLGVGADEGTVGRALTHMVQTLAYDFISHRIDERNEDPDAEMKLGDLYQLTRTVRNAAKAGLDSQAHQSITRKAVREQMQAEMRDKIRALGSARELKELSDAELERKIAELAQAGA